MLEKMELVMQQVVTMHQAEKQNLQKELGLLRLVYSVKLCLCV